MRRSPGVARALLWATAGTATFIGASAAARRRFGRPPRRPLVTPSTGARDVTIRHVEGHRLRGWLLPATGMGDTTPIAAAVLVHGWGASAGDMMPVAALLTDLGLAVLVLDARCHGRSDDSRVASMPAFADDVEAAVQWLVKDEGIDPRRVVLAGHSVGAGACLLVASRNPAVAGVLSLASMAHPREFMTGAFARARMPSFIVSVLLRAVEHQIRHRFDTFAPLHTIARVSAPVLIVHGTDDDVVPVDDARRLHARAGGSAHLLVVPGANHYSVDSLRRVAGDVRAWLDDTGVLRPDTAPATRG